MLGTIILAVAIVGYFIMDIRRRRRIRTFIEENDIDDYLTEADDVMKVAAQRIKDNTGVSMTFALDVLFKYRKMHRG